jgi:uncharacterized protein YtpQ (UPF0354 family)
MTLMNYIRKALGQVVGAGLAMVSTSRSAGQTKPVSQALRTPSTIVPLVRPFFGNDNIIPVEDIKPIAGPMKLDLPGQGTVEQRLIFDTFVGDLHIRYGFDSPTGVNLVTEEDLQRLGVDRKELLSLAVNNFKRLYPDLAIERPQPGVGMLTLAGELEASALLDRDLWEAERNRFGVDIVVAVPLRDVVMFTGVTPPQNIQQLKRIVDKAYDEGGRVAVSRLLYVWRNRHWEVFNG